MSTVIYVKPYQTIEDKIFTGKTTLKIIDSLLLGTDYRNNQTTFNFLRCTFDDVQIESPDDVIYEVASFHFYNCTIKDFGIGQIKSENIEIIFSSSLVSGNIHSSKLRRVSLNNCLILTSIFINAVQKVSITYSESNIFPFQWKRLLENFTESKSLLEDSQTYFIYDVVYLEFLVNESEDGKAGVYYSSIGTSRLDRVRYIPSEAQKKLMKINLAIHNSPFVDQKSVSINGGKLRSLSLSNATKASVMIEHCRIDNVYLHHFSSTNSTTLYDIAPFHSDGEKLFEIKLCSLENILFDNIVFDSYDRISFYRNKYNKTLFTSCVFPTTIQEFKKFLTVENIHYPAKLDEHYYTRRYQTFLELKKILESLGDIHEAQNFKAVSNEALRQIANLPTRDKLILFFNNCTNQHGLSISRPFWLLAGSSILLYLTYLYTLDRIFKTTDIDYNLIGYYFSFLDITHRSDFLLPKENLNGWSQAIDYLNKVIVGILIYQFISAFRKYGKSGT